MAKQEPTQAQCFAAELIGTFILIFFGCGAVHAAVLYEAQAGLWQVAIVWGVAIMLAIYATGAISGAHINPAITITLAVWGDFPSSKVVSYIVAQMCGAFLAAATLYLLFSPKLAAYEVENGIIRGQPGSEITASCYGEFFPNPGGLVAGDAIYDQAAFEAIQPTVPHHVAFFAEVIGTAILAMMVFGCTDPKNAAAPSPKLAGVFIGLTVAVLISVIAPLTQACFNPARDLAPRLFTVIAGWGSVALPIGTDWGWLTVYIIAPIIGALAGGALYAKLLRPAYLNSPAD